jgi:DNA invertase Pin-like site-specific DNA recombinase
VFHIFGALAGFELNLIRERTYAGLAAARARGRKGGRRKKLGDKQRAVAVDLYRQKRGLMDSEFSHFVATTSVVLSSLLPNSF